MVLLRSEHLLSVLIDTGFIIVATGLALFTGYIALASFFGAKALLSLYLTAAHYRRNKRLRFQLIEHLYRSDVYARVKRP